MSESGPPGSDAMPTKSETNGTTPSDVEAQLSPPYHSKDYHAWRDCKKMDAVDQGEGRNPTWCSHGGLHHCLGRSIR
ncbi:hypothetical protein F2P79_009155, partial [Pimephales promelas]